MARVHLLLAAPAQGLRLLSRLLLRRADHRDLGVREARRGDVLVVDDVLAAADVLDGADALGRRRVGEHLDAVGVADAVEVLVGDGAAGDADRPLGVGEDAAEAYRQEFEIVSRIQRETPDLPRDNVYATVRSVLCAECGNPSPLPGRVTRGKMSM